MANIKLNNNSYPIPDSVLAGPRADFIAHLGTIAGNGLKVVVGGVEYSVDSTKVAGAFEVFEGALDELDGGVPEGEKKFKTIVYHPDMGAADFCEMSTTANGAPCVNEAVLPTKSADNIMVSDFTTVTMYLYYIEDENGIFAYGDYTYSGNNDWLNLSDSTGLPFNGTITDISEATEVGLYALIYYDVAL